MSPSSQGTPQQKKCIKSFVTRLDPDRITRWVNFPTRWKFVWTGPEDRPFLALGAARVLTANGLSRVTKLRQSLNDLRHTETVNKTPDEPPTQALPRFVGALSFFRRESLRKEWKSFPSACFILPRIQLLQGQDCVWVTFNQVESTNPVEDSEFLLRQLERFEGAPSVSDVGPNSIRNRTHLPDDETWTKRVDSMRSECRNEDLQKIVLAQQRQFTLDRPISLERLTRDITAYGNETFGYLFQPGTREMFVGSSPERLVSRRGQMVKSESLAGTIQSDRSADTRESLAKELSSSSKDQREHNHVVDFLKNRLSPLVSSLETVPQSVRTLPTLQHLLTVFRGKLHSDHHVLELVRELHPTPAVAGRPSGRALAQLRELESFERGLYAGPIGWFDASGNGEFAVGIRSARIRGTRATLFAGAGIIPESEPEDELDELNLKFNSIRRFLFNETS